MEVTVFILRNLLLFPFWLHEFVVHLLGLKHLLQFSFVFIIFIFIIYGFVLHHHTDQLVKFLKLLQTSMDWFVISKLLRVDVNLFISFISNSSLVIDFICLSVCSFLLWQSSHLSSTWNFVAFLSLVVQVNTKNLLNF